MPDSATADKAQPAKVSKGKAGILWVTILGGSFSMGSTSTDGATPVHQVTLKPFEMSKTEVSVAQYRVCVKSGICADPKQRDWSRSSRENHPINGVDWSQARAFCKWAGGRLPSEAEWEYAGRSQGRDWKYPWGNAKPTCERAVMHDRTNNCGKSGTLPVCSRPAGNTKQGLCDMMGNVNEYVEDCMHADYQGAPVDGRAWTENCRRTMPYSGMQCHIVRGGYFKHRAAGLGASERYYDTDGNYHTQGGPFPSTVIGFRCAK